MRTVDIAFYIVKRLFEEGWSIAIDSDCAGPNVKAKVEEFAKQFNYRDIWIHIDPPEDFILNKLRNFKHTWLFRDVDHAINDYYRRKPLHENLDFDFFYTFDTSREDLQEQIHKFLEKLRSSLQE